MPMRMKKYYATVTGAGDVTLTPADGGADRVGIPVSTEEGVLVEVWTAWNFTGTTFTMQMQAKAFDAAGAEVELRPIPFQILSNAGATDNTIDETDGSGNSMARFSPGNQGQDVRCFACDLLVLDVVAWNGTSMDLVVFAVYE